MSETKQANLRCAVGIPFDRIEVWKLWTNWEPCGEPRWGIYRILGSVMTMVSLHPTKKEAFAAAKKLGTALGKKAFMVEEVLSSMAGDDRHGDGRLCLPVIEPGRDKR